MQPEVILQGIGVEEFYSKIQSIFRQELEVGADRVAVKVQPDESLTLDQVCALMKVGLGTVHQLKRTGELPFWKVGGRVYIKKSHCLAILTGDKIAQES